MCKANFYDRALVIYAVSEKLRHGELQCPLCGGPLSVHGSYRRHIRDGEDKRHEGWIAQGKCSGCKTYPSLIPDFIMPYKHFGADVIEAAISKAEEEGTLCINDCPADESTIRRWINQFQERGAQAAGRLLAILCTVYGEYISLLETQNKGLLKQLARLAMKIPVPGTGGIIGKVNVILTRHNSGFL